MGNNCGTFARDVIAQDENVDNPIIIRPTPRNIVDEYIEEGNAEVNYDPKKDETTIGQGDESDAKKEKAITTAKETTWSALGSLIYGWIQTNQNIKLTIR